MDDEFPTWGIGCIVVAVVGVIIGVAILLSGAQVSAGYVGVVSNWGAIDKAQQPMDPGFHVVMPFATHIQSVSVQPQNYSFAEVGAASKELQNVYVDGGINYVIDPNQAATITIEGGPDAIISRVLAPAFQDYIKETVPQYPAVCEATDQNCTNILQARAKIRDAVLAQLQTKAHAYGIDVRDLFLTNVHFDKAYTQAIEDAAVAKQEQTKTITQAQANLQKAQIDAQAAVTAAQGQAQANKLLNDSLSQNLIDYQELQKWDGHLPQVTGGSSPFVSIQPTK